MAMNKFASIQVGLASPEKIKEWSHGEVKKPETINYRSQKPERDGLFCERIFGPSKDWECACGKYKKVRYQGVVCDKCGVEVTKASVRRERMGHIELAAPVAHIWYLKGTPSRMALLLDVSPKALEEVVYFVTRIVVDPGNTPLLYKQILTEREYREAQKEYGFSSFKAMTGAEAVEVLLKEVDVKKEHQDVLSALETAAGDKRKKLIKRLETLEAFVYSDNEPSWMILTMLPVIPPDLRPMLQLDGGRFATSDLNDLYRRVITRNNRLKKLLEIGTPSIIVQNEKRMLQESVDALIDNGKRAKSVTGPSGRPLKSLSNSLKGKQGRFRQNLLGKRVDFSARSVIAVGPDLKMFQCGIPREMALILFRPFILNELCFQNPDLKIKKAEKMIDNLDPSIWKVVEEVVENHPVLLNRAPTLHRLGIQSFMPKLVEGRAIRLHPLVTPAFNADFDGDQMAVHLPLSEEAQAEAEILMLGSNNILGPKDGKPIVTPSQDMVLGNFYLTMEETAEDFMEAAKKSRRLGDEAIAQKWERIAANEGHVFKDVDEIFLAYDNKEVHLHTRIAIRASALDKDLLTEEQKKQYLITSVGKIIYNQMFPKDFAYINDVNAESFIRTPDKYFVPYGTNVKEYISNLPVGNPFKKKDLGVVIAKVFEKYGANNTYKILDHIKDYGFKYSTVAGMTVALSDINVASNKQEMVAIGKEKTEQLNRSYNRGKLTMPERDKLLSKVWEDTKAAIGDCLMAELPNKNPINMMATSGARGNKNHFTQLAGMRGLVGKPTQSKSKKDYQTPFMEVPIYSSLREGSNVLEFFISTHGVRKGLTDTALKTAESGYLTRRLVDVAQDVIVSEEDCGCDKGYMARAITKLENGKESIIESLYDRIEGRYAKDDVINPNTGEVIVASDEYIDEKIARQIIDAGIEEVYIRTTFTCETQHGVCKKCYGKNMATGKVVEIGESVGVMAAQSIGEPGTQLTMRTFHTGGVVSGESGDITSGLPRVEELFEARCPKHAALIAKIAGRITAIETLENNIGTRIVIANEKEEIEHKADRSQSLRKGIAVGDSVDVGEPLTEGSINPKELLPVSGVLAVQNYILKEVRSVYNAQSIDISDKHIEIIVRQMLKKVLVTDGNDTKLSAGQTISLPRITDVNLDVILQGLTPAKFQPTLLGITKAAVETDSFLSAASFQETTKVLTDAAVKGKIDSLLGLKENVIIGARIPAGTGRDFDRESSRLIKARTEELSLIRQSKNLDSLEHRELPEEVTGKIVYDDEKTTAEMVEDLILENIEENE
ncbi:MAG: DNA-directed RNA polymerase subunit beta' [Erysipelotrichaceae bacterium]